VKKRTLGVGLVAALVASLALVVASIGSASGQQGDYKMAVVTDIGSLQDRSFNELANRGRIAIDDLPGFETRVYETKVAADRLPNLLAAANGDFDLVYGTGFLMFPHLDAIVPRYPDTWFAGIDVTTFLLSKPYPNYIGIQFAEHEAGYLVGYLAALQVTREGKGLTIGAVGANNVPPILKFMSGYIQGAKKANPKVKMLINFANDPTFSDQAKCKEQALNQIQKGARVIFQVAGGCGLGVHSAAKEAGIRSIGVDADQAYLGPHVLTSAIKRVDLAVQYLTKYLKAFPNAKGGRDINYTIKSGAIGLGTTSPKVHPADLAKVEAIEALMKKGQIKIVPILERFGGTS
jgi:basic membrane protein A